MLRLIPVPGSFVPVLLCALLGFNDVIIAQCFELGRMKCSQCISNAYPDASPVPTCHLGPCATCDDDNYCGCDGAIVNRSFVTVPTPIACQYADSRCWDDWDLVTFWDDDDKVTRVRSVTCGKIKACKEFCLEIRIDRRDSREFWCVVEKKAPAVAIRCSRYKLKGELCYEPPGG